MMFLRVTLSAGAIALLFGTASLAQELRVEADGPPRSLSASEQGHTLQVSQELTPNTTVAEAKAKVGATQDSAQRYNRVP